MARTSYGSCRSSVWRKAGAAGVGDRRGTRAHATAARYDAADMALRKDFTAAAGPWGWSQTAEMTARKSAPAWTRGAQFSGEMPPMATDGTVMISLHQR